MPYEGIASVLMILHLPDEEDLLHPEDKGLTRQDEDPLLRGEEDLPLLKEDHFVQKKKKEKKGRVKDF